MEKAEFVLSADDASRRLDRVIRKFLTALPLSRIYAAIRKGNVRVNGRRVSSDYKTAIGDVLTIDRQLLDRSHLSERNSGTGKNSGAACNGRKQKTVPLPVLLETDDLLIINKPAGIAVHGAYSVQSILAERLSDSQHTASLSFTPGPLHRLDKNTTGVLCFSRTLNGAQWFSHCLRMNMMGKYYLGVVNGCLPSRLIRTVSGGQEAVTRCFPISYNESLDSSLMLFNLITGKKHQIRKHMQETGHPLAGDKKYGGGRTPAGCTGYLLHAWRLSFPERRLEGLPAYIEAPLSSCMDSYLSRFFPDWKNAPEIRDPVR